MHRPRNLRSLLVVPVLFALVLTVAGCGGSSEEPMIRKFFTAAGMSDNVTIGNIATVSFDPSTDGRATGIKVVSETEPTTRILNIKGLEKARQEAQAAETEFSKKKGEYQDKNLEAINRILKIEATNGKVTGKDAEVQAAWTKWREETAVHARAVSEARTKLQAERRVADLSVPDRDVSAFEATEVTKEVTVTANVQAPNGQKSNKTLVLTLQKVSLKDEAGKTIEGRWFITGIKEAPKASS